jgi:hypothetical protein
MWNVKCKKLKARFYVFFFVGLGWKGEGVVELGFKFISKMSFIQCWVGILV